MTTTLEPGVHAPAPTRTTPPSRTPAAPSTTFEDTPADTDTEPKTSRHLWLMIPLAAVAALSGMTAAATGFALSYGALRDAAIKWGYTGWQSYAFPIGVDGLIIALYTADLVLAWRQMARPWVRVTAHALTAVTIALNVSAAVDGMPGTPTLAEALGQDFGRVLGHAMMPIAYVILTEVARWAIARTAHIEAGLPADQVLTLAEWVMNFPVTWKVFRHAKTNPATYADARKFAREMAIYRVWQKERALYATGTAADRASVLDRMPALLAPYGVSVDEARAIPAERLEQEQLQDAERQRAEQQRKRDREQQQQAEQREKERQERENAHQASMDALAKEAEETRQKGELAELKATVDGQTRAAAHRAEAVVATAEIQAATATTAAQRAAEESARRAAAEEAAEESAKVATERAKEKAAVAKVLEDEARVLEAQRKKTEESAKLAAEQEKEKAALAKVVEDQARVLEGQRKVAEEEARIEQARHAAAQTALRAAEAEALASLSARELRERVVARFLIDSMPVETVRSLAPQDLAARVQLLPITNAKIGELIGGAKESTASSHKTAAVELIARGYNHHTGYDPDLTTTTEG